jgi:hypothetical protein
VIEAQRVDQVDERPAAAGAAMSEGGRPLTEAERATGPVAAPTNAPDAPDRVS